jgi:heat shock protein HslJ
MNSFKSSLGSVLLIVFLVTACKNDPQTKESEVNTPISSSETSENALDWNGQYKGTLPCADCEGIATTLTLKSDGSFQRVVYYRGKSDTANVDRGKFEWDTSGSTITIILDNDQTQSYKVGENQLWHLDQNGEMISGDLAAKYILTKNLMDFQLENKTWVLKELMGQPIVTEEGDTQAHLQFNSENAMITGSNGCNRISMGYELLEGQRLKIAPGISTLMACPEDSISDTFNEVLQRADNYTVSDGELHLNKARMAPMAKFIEQELKE